MIYTFCLIFLLLVFIDKVISTFNPASLWLLLAGLCQSFAESTAIFQWKWAKNVPDIWPWLDEVKLVLYQFLSVKNPWFLSGFLLFLTMRNWITVDLCFPRYAQMPNNRIQTIILCKIISMKLHVSKTSNRNCIIILPP